MKTPNLLSLLFGQSTGTQRVLARTYLGAALETHFLSLVVTWIFTLIWYPYEAWKHPKVITLGAFNFCFSWDFPPGNYIGLFMSSFMVYFLWRYAILVNMRAKLHHEPSLSCCCCKTIHGFAAFWTYFQAMSASFYLLIWLLGPISAYDGPIHMPKLGVLPGPDYKVPMIFESWTLHTVAFLSFAIASWLSYVGVYLESKYGAINSVKPKHTYYIIAYSISMIGFVFVYLIQDYMEYYHHYGKNHPEIEKCVPRESLLFAANVTCSFLPGQVTIVANWCWFISLMLAPQFMDLREPAITESYLVSPLEEEEEPLAGIQMN